MIRFFPSQDVKQNKLLSSYLDNGWHHKLQDKSLIIFEGNGQQGEEEGKTEIQKVEYLENKKSFLDERKTFFIVFEGLSKSLLSLWTTSNYWTWSFNKVSFVWLCFFLKSIIMNWNFPV